MPLHPLEEATIRAFIKREKRERYLSLIANSKRRAKFLNCLNHCDDFDNRFVETLASTCNVGVRLADCGAPPECYLISDVLTLDRQTMRCTAAIDAIEIAGFGTILCCVPGRLACYIEEAVAGRRQLLQES